MSLFIQMEQFIPVGTLFGDLWNSLSMHKSIPYSIPFHCCCQQGLLFHSIAQSSILPLGITQQVSPYCSLLTMETVPSCPYPMYCLALTLTQTHSFPFWNVYPVISIFLHSLKFFSKYSFQLLTLDMKQFHF